MKIVFSHVHKMVQIGVGAMSLNGVLDTDELEAKRSRATHKRDIGGDAIYIYYCAGEEIMAGV